MKKTENIFKAVILAAIALSAIAAAARGGDAKSDAFDHKFHIDQGTSCNDCHKTAKEAAEAGMPKCADCHDAGKYKDASHANKLKVAFPHKAHKDMDCKDCHGDVAKNEMKTPKTGDCDKCHAENQVAATCEGCHGKKNFKPEYHNGAFKFKHGLTAKMQVIPEHGKDCRLCHKADSCKACHTKEKPLNHTGFWRLRGHGLKAQMDADSSCKTCHTENYCIRCHQNSKPMSHTGAWKNSHGGRVEGSNCKVCHHKLETDCKACHK